MLDVPDPRDHFGDLEAYLAGAPVVCGYPQTGGGWQPKYRVVLEGGILALQKPVLGSNAPGGGAEGIRREVASWRIAKTLGWSRLVAPTVLRALETPPAGGAVQEASLQVIWPDPLLPLHDLAAFDLFDVWRAAALDVVIRNTDRGNNNWMGMGPDLAGTLHLKLIDHAQAFGAGPVNSSFATFVAGEAAPVTVRDEITIGLNGWAAARVEDLVGGGAAGAVRARLAAVAAGTRLADVQ